MKLISKIVYSALIIVYSCHLMAAAKLKNIEIYGVSKKVKTNIETRLAELNQTKPLKNETNDELIKQVKQAMHPYGYYQADIKIIHQNKNHLSIVIEPGKRIIINQFSLTIIGDGRENAAIKETSQTLGIKEGNPLNSVTYEKAKQALIDTAEQQGYLHSTFDKAEVLIDKTAYTADITLAFNTGMQYYFGQVNFDPAYISPQVLQRYVPFKYGQPYSPDAILSFSNSLSGSGYFKEVAVQPEFNQNSTVPINVHLQRVSHVDYTVGLGFGTDTGARGRAGAHIIPVNRLGHKFNAIILGSFKENALQSQYIIPGKNPLVDQYEIINNVSNLDYNSGYSNSTLMSLVERHNLNNFQRVLSLNGLYERFNYTDQPRLYKFTLYPKASLTWLSKSDELFSPNGYKITLNGLAANDMALSAVNFAQASIDAKAALTMEAIHTRFYFHTLQGVTQINNINQLPLSLALLLGGADDLKGYSFDALGPGKILSYAGMEIQKETFAKWYLVGFVDAGDVYKPDVKSFKYDAGAGLMWVSPIGPIKIGVAQAIDSHFNRLADKTPKLVISMGPEF